MRPRDVALAVAVTAIWGVNFVVIETGLDHFPPLLFNALRFTLAAFPAVLFAGRPRVPWRWVIAVGLTLGVVKFSLLFAGMAAGMPAGLSSLVLQSQAVFTVLFAVLLLRERPRAVQVAGLLLALAGVGLVGVRMGADLGAFVLIIGAAAAWGLSNIATRKASPPDTLRFMVWASAVACGPLIVLSLVIDGPATDLAALRAIDAEAIGALLYVALLATLTGFGIWGSCSAGTAPRPSRRSPCSSRSSASPRPRSCSARRSAPWTWPAACSWSAASWSVSSAGTPPPRLRPPRRRSLGWTHDGGGAGDSLSRRGRWPGGQGGQLRRPA